MALLQLSAPVTQISGRIGGQIFGTASTGSYLKNNAYSQQSVTASQSLQRTKTQQFTQLWRATSAAQKILWAAETPNYPYINRVGDTVEYNAYQLFLKLNANRLLINAAALLTPPTFAAVVNDTYSITTATTANIILQYTAALATTTSVIQATPMLPAGVTPQAKDFRTIFIFAHAAGAVSVSLFLNYLTVFPTPVINNYIFFRIREVHTASGNTADFSNPFGSIVS